MDFLNLKITDETIARLFFRFHEIYGRKWQVWPPGIELVYKNALTGLSNAEIKRGLYLCELRKHDKIPSAIEFWHWCKGIKYDIKRKKT